MGCCNTPRSLDVICKKPNNKRTINGVRSYFIGRSAAALHGTERQVHVSAGALGLQRPNSSSSPEKLLRLVRAGDSERMGRLLQLYRNYLQLLAESELDRKLRARISPSDIVQDTMLEAYRDFAQFRGTTEAEFIAWLRQILINNLAEVISKHVLTEKRDVRRDISLAKFHASFERSTMKLRDALVADIDSPCDDAERRERAVLLADVMSELSDDHREVLVLRNLRGLPFKAVAIHMERSVPATKMLWMRAVKQLRELSLSRFE